MRGDSAEHQMIEELSPSASVRMIFFEALPVGSDAIAALITPFIGASGACVGAFEWTRPIATLHAWAAASPAVEPRAARRLAKRCAT